MQSTMDVRSWAEAEFGDCDLGDRRRTRRLVKLAAQLAECPDGSTPEATRTLSDCKAAYRLCDSERATFQAVGESHWRRTRQSGPGRFLIISDQTHLSFHEKREIEGVGPIGDGRGQGFILHSAMMVDPETDSVLGLADQQLHVRKPAPKKENKSQRFRRPRESELWASSVERIGRPPEGAQFIHVMDRGSDNFELFDTLRRCGADWVSRASVLTRNVIDASKRTRKLSQAIASAKVLGEYELHVAGHRKRDARTARMEISVTSIKMPKPRHMSPATRARAPEAVQMNVVVVRERDVPDGVMPLKWVLFTSLEVDTYDQAWEVVSHYEKRVMIEVWHKALKTGCKTESRLQRTADRLQPMIAVLSVVAVRLLQLKNLALTDPDCPAEEHVPATTLQMLTAARRPTQPKILTVRDFIRGVAMLGGFLGRKHDGEPGWITIWRGWARLRTLERGAELASLNARRCG